MEKQKYVQLNPEFELEKILLKKGIDTSMADR
jgi:hypothetical protein